MSATEFERRDERSAFRFRAANTDAQSLPDPLPCDVIVEAAPLDGARNMSVDAELLECVCRKPDRCFVRIYRWSQPTLTLGYFQPDSPASLPEALRECPRVRRLTGGGAILHDREVTYSCVVPPSHFVGKNPTRLYEIVHLAIIDCLATCGVNASMRGQQPSANDQTCVAEQPFLCFSRGDDRDLIFKGHKIVGSAQRRRRGSILQHGSILLAASRLTAGIPGLVELQSKFDHEQFVNELPKAIASGISGLLRFED